MAAQDAPAPVDLVAARDHHVARLQKLFDGQTLDHAFTLCGLGGGSSIDVLSDPRGWAGEAAASLESQAPRLMERATFHPLIFENWIYGVHFIDHLLGGRVYFSQGQWWCDFLKRPVGTLEMPDLDKFSEWRRAREMALACVELGSPVTSVATQVLSSALNIIINLYGEEVLAAMIADEAAVRRDLRVINDLICTLHRWHLQNIPANRFQPVCAGGRFQPPGFGQICGCSTHLISAAMYRDLIAPLDDEVFSLYPRGGLIHLCGDHTRHIPVWRELKSFRAFQINDRAAEDLEIYFNELRPDQIIYLNPTATMTIDRALKITKGRRLVIVADVKEPITAGTQ